MIAQSRRTGVLVVALAFTSALAGCDGAIYDADTGRIIEQGAANARSTSSSRRSAAADDAARVDDTATATAAGAAQPASASRYVPPPAPPRDAFASGSGGGASFDAFSRTPPQPVTSGGAAAAAPMVAVVSPPSGAVEGGNEVLITGSGFANAQVLFGSALARVTSQSSNAITVIVPEGAAHPVSVVVTNRDGTYAVAGAGYTYR